MRSMLCRTILIEENLNFTTSNQVRTSYYLDMTCILIFIVYEFGSVWRCRKNIRMTYTEMIKILFHRVLETVVSTDSIHVRVRDGSKHRVVKFVMCVVVYTYW